MPKISHNELNSIKDIVTSHHTMSAKLSSYANQCQDNDIKQMFKSAAADAEKSAQTLIQMMV